MRWLCALLVLASGCRIGFDSIAAASDGGLDGGLGGDASDVALVTRTVTFGERPTSMVQNVTADAEVIAGEPAFNYGGGLDNSVYDDFERTLLRFDLGSVKPGSVVTRVAYSIYIIDSGDEIAGTLQARLLEESWVEGTGQGDLVPGVTWDARGTGANWSIPGGTTTSSIGATGVGTSPGFIELQITPLVVQGWLDNPSTNFGILLISPDGGHWHPAGKEWPTPSERPELTLDLTDP